MEQGFDVSLFAVEVGCRGLVPKSCVDYLKHILGLKGRRIGDCCIKALSEAAVNASWRMFRARSTRVFGHRRTKRKKVPGCAFNAEMPTPAVIIFWKWISNTWQQLIDLSYYKKFMVSVIDCRYRSLFFPFPKTLSAQLQLKVFALCHTKPNIKLIKHIEQTGCC